MTRRTPATSGDSQRDLLAVVAGAMPEEAGDAAERCAAALHERLSKRGEVSKRTVLLGYGGGKDSSYTVAFVRLVQLLHQRDHDETFVLRVMTNRQPGMPAEVLANIGRAYSALDMTDDPRCELLLRDGEDILPFADDLPVSPAVTRRYREDVLMAGHRSAGSGRPTFCNSCNFDMVGSFAAGATAGAGADLIITGDSERERRMYQIWVRRLAEQVSRGPGDGSGYARFQRNVSEVADSYFLNLHGEQDTADLKTRALPMVADDVEFFSIYDYTDYSSGSHWSLLTGFLGFEFGELSFNFTESDCGNPLLMAHLHGLRQELVLDGDYADGVREYVEFAVDLMRRKDIPERLVEVMCSRYAGAAGIAQMRARARSYAESTYSLQDDQLSCMVFAPFVGGAAELEHYLRRMQPELLPHVDDIRNALRGGQTDPSLVAALERVSGLRLAKLRHLFLAPASTTVTSLTGTDLFSAILKHDPHKRPRQSASAMDPQYISGR